MLEVALVAGDDTDGGDGGAVGAVGGLVVDEGAEGREAHEAGRAGDVVDEQEGVGGERGRRPEGAVLLLPGGVGEREQVRAAVDVARHGVGVFDGRVVAGAVCCQLRGRQGVRAESDDMRGEGKNILLRPLAAHQSQRDGALACVAHAPCSSVSHFSVLFAPCFEGHQGWGAPPFWHPRPIRELNSTHRTRHRRAP